MKKIISCWNAGIFIAILIMLVTVNMKSLDYLVNSDFAAQIVLADVINKAHFILPKEWNFSTEIHISFATLFSSFMLKFCGKWNICYMVSNVLTYIVLIISGYYLCKILKMKNLWIILTLTMFLAPISYWNLYYYSIGNEYLTYFIYELVYLALWLQVKEKNCRKCHFFFLGVWSFFLGTMGMRYLLACFAPAIFVNLIDLWKRNEYSQNDFIEKYVHLGCTYISFLIGIFVNKFVLSTHYTVKEHSRYFKSWEEFPDRVSISLQRIFELFGYTEKAMLFSKQGIVNILSIVIVMIVLLAVVWSWKFTKDNYYIKFVVYANVINALVLVLTCEDENYYNDIRGKYFILGIYLFFPVVSMFLCRLVEEEKSFRGGVLLGVLSLCLLANSAVASMKERNIDSYDYSKQIINHLVDDGITNGYASFWNANINVYYSDGMLSISPVKDFVTLELQKHISSSRQYEDNQAADKYFIWLTEDENEKYGDGILNVIDSFTVGENIIYICTR